MYEIGLRLSKVIRVLEKTPGLTAAQISDAVGCNVQKNINTYIREGYLIRDKKSSTYFIKPDVKLKFKQIYPSSYKWTKGEKKHALYKYIKENPGCMGIEVSTALGCDLSALFSFYERRQLIEKKDSRYYIGNATPQSITNAATKYRPIVHNKQEIQCRNFDNLTHALVSKRCANGGVKC